MRCHPPPLPHIQRMQRMLGRRLWQGCVLKTAHTLAIACTPDSCQVLNFLSTAGVGK